jgi:alpha,alpha-trehalase
MAQPEIYELHPLFDDVQMNEVFADSKTFVDCIPKLSTEVILQQYLQKKIEPVFDLKEFVFSQFDVPNQHGGNYETDSNKTAAEHIEELWPILTRQPDEKNGSLIPLPSAYIVPGGRFGEVYYWDSYFTMLGLAACGNVQMIEDMVNNFSHLIKTVGYIPNGNRTYYLGRSQPPFYSLMVGMLADMKDGQQKQQKNILADYLEPLEAEYRFWMNGVNELNTNCTAIKRVVRMKDGEVLNRYWDESETPRPESYREDVHLAQSSSQPANVLFRHLRAGAESGWDYSSRWFQDEINFHTIHSTAIVPIDLNCLLLHLEETISEACRINGDEVTAGHYQSLAEKRIQAIQKYCWNENIGFYTDYDLDAGSQKTSMTLAGAAPLFFKLATQDQAKQIAGIIEKTFLKPGGVVSTLKNTGQQWDAPNGWAPLQWIAAIGLKNYGYDALAETIASRWIALNDKVYKATGKMMEKYNVEDLSQLAGGGEYESQDGFGWTNGVYLAFQKMLAQ